MSDNEVKWNDSSLRILVDEIKSEFDSSHGSVNVLDNSIGTANTSINTSGFVLEENPKPAEYNIVDASSNYQPSTHDGSSTPLSLIDSMVTSKKADNMRSCVLGSFPSPDNKRTVSGTSTEVVFYRSKRNGTTKRKLSHKKNIAWPIDRHSKRSDTSVDDTDEDEDYIPSLDGRSYSSSTRQKRARRRAKPKGKRFSSSTTEKKNHFKHKISKPDSFYSLESNGIDSYHTERGDALANLLHFNLSSSDEETPSSDSENASTDSDEEPWFQMREEDFMPKAAVQFLEDAGPKHMLPVDSSPIDYFNLFFTLALTKMVANETNRYATQFIEKALNADLLQAKSRTTEWIPVTYEEIRIFIGCVINMGLVRKNTIASYWSSLPNSSTPWFGRMFSRNRFQLILKFLHLVNNEELAKKPYDPCDKFMPIIDHANHLFRHYYTPNQKLSVHKSLVVTKSHSCLTQYLTKKHRRRIKLFVLCDSYVNYILGFHVYRGGQTPAEKKYQQNFGAANAVVYKLLQMGNYLNKGYHVYLNNLFTSVPLARHLYDSGTYITGTVRMNMKLLPQAIKARFEVGMTQFFKNGPLLLCGHRDKKSHKVILLSSNATTSTTEVERRVRQQNEPEKIKKPDVILEYNKYMGGVDNSDMMIYSYLDERRTIKNWKKVVFNVITRMVLNSYILYKENVKPSHMKKPMSRLQFTESVVNTLGNEWLALKGNSQKSQPTEVNPLNHEKPIYGVKKLSRTMLRKCYVCSTPKKLRRSHFVCVTCEKGLHPECIHGHKCKM